MSPRTSALVSHRRRCHHHSLLWRHTAQRKPWHRSRRHSVAVKNKHHIVIAQVVMNRNNLFLASKALVVWWLRSCLRMSESMYNHNESVQTTSKRFSYTDGCIREHVHVCACTCVHYYYVYIHCCCLGWRHPGFLVPQATRCYLLNCHHDVPPCHQGQIRLCKNTRFGNSTW